MPISVRLDKKTDAMLEAAAAALGTSKASVIKESLARYCPRVLANKGKRPYELIKDIAGRRGSGKGDLAFRSEEILRDAFKGRRR